jgi:HD-GYP domain-containing protein (c-di-GMP phosphodiesterase class II)
MMAEAFDSMTMDQPWRPRLGLEKIVEQISRNLGLQFEPRVVQALIDAVNAGLEGRAAQPDFVPHLEASFDPALIKTMLTELRRQLDLPRTSAVVIESITSA